ncbi:helix-turn-helix transcriptional regulator [Kitasatospora sp. NPDC001664]
MPPLEPELASGNQRLAELVAAGASHQQIAAETTLDLDAEDVRGAIEDLLAFTGTRTVLHLAAWATARRIVTTTVHPCAALVVRPQLAPRLLTILRGWSGGRSTPELTADSGVSPGTMRTYCHTLLTRLGVDNQPQACVAGVLSGVVLLSDIDPAWPSEALAAAPTSGGPA